MKIRILDRILVALAGLVMIAAGAALAAQLFFGKDVVGFATRLLENGSLRIFIIIGGAVLCLIGIYCVLMLFRHRGKKGKFITQKTDAGELAISLKALESMVQKCLEPHRELTTQGIRLDNQKGSLLIRIRGTVAGGISIPLTIDTLQQQIKQYVTACSGVEVKEIKVMIESSGSDAKDAPFAIAAPSIPALPKGNGEPAKETEEPVSAAPAGPADAPAEPAEQKDSAEKTAMNAAAAVAAAAAALMDEVPPEDDDRPVHQRLFSTVEEPCVMPMPPTAEEIKADVNAEEKPAEGADEAAAADPEEKKPSEGADETAAADPAEEKPADRETDDGNAEDTAIPEGSID